MMILCLVLKKVVPLPAKANHNKDCFYNSPLCITVGPGQLGSFFYLMDNPHDRNRFLHLLLLKSCALVVLDERFCNFFLFYLHHRSEYTLRDVFKESGKKWWITTFCLQWFVLLSTVR